MLEKHTGYRALPTAAENALNLTVSKYSRNQADSETRYTPPFHGLLQHKPRPASPHTRDVLLKDYSTLLLLLILLFLPDSCSASRWRRDAKLSAKPGQSALTLYANASPQPQLTHSFCTHHHSLIIPSIYFFHLLICNASLLHFSLFLRPLLLLHFTHFSHHFLPFHALTSTNCHFSIAIHLPAFLPPLPTHSILCGTPSHRELDSPRLKLVTCTLTPHCQTGKCITPPIITNPQHHHPHHLFLPLSHSHATTTHAGTSLKGKDSPP